MSEMQNMGVVKAIVDKYVDYFILRVKQSLEKNDYYIDALHRTHLSFGIINNVSDEVLEQAGEMQGLEYFIRECLVNPIIFELFQIHGITPHRAEESRINKDHGYLVRSSNGWYEKTFFYQMLFQGKSIRPNALKYTDEAMFNKRFRRHSLLLNKIYIVDWNENGNVSDRAFFHDAKSSFEKKVELISLLDLFEMYFTKEEYEYCSEKMRNAIAEANRIMGFNSIRMLTPRYMHEVKKSIEEDLLCWNLTNQKYHFIEYDNRVRSEITVDKNIVPTELHDIDAAQDTEKMIRNCYESKRYKALIGKGEFAKCFITSEYLYQLFKKVQWCDVKGVTKENFLGRGA